MVPRILFGLLLLTSVAPWAGAGEALVDGPRQRAIVAELQRLIGEHYVLDEGARRLVEGLQEAVGRGEFDAPRPTTAFIELSNGVLQRAFPDRHLGVLASERYQEMQRRFHSAEAGSPAGHEGGAHAPPSGDRPAGANEGDALREVAGISRVAEINRDGLNQIGYLALERFDGSPRAVAAIDRVFHTFSDSERLIIDLRECAGGDADMVKILSSYLFAEPTHLVSSTGPRNAEGERAVMERWTTPNAMSAQFAGKPVDVLISHRTFSAAESFAFGLKVTGRARLIGQASGGGGHMNDFFPLPDGLGASISVGRTYDPRTGKGWEAQGIPPDVVTPVGHALSETIAIITRESGRLTALDAGQTAIYARIQDYANSWYGGDAQSMAGLLAADFQAFHSDANPERGGAAVSRRHRDRNAQLAATAAGAGVLPPLYHNRIISGIEVAGNQATARLVLRETTHQLRLRLETSGWVIVIDESRDKPRHGVELSFTGRRDTSVRKDAVPQSPV